MIIHLKDYITNQMKMAHIFQAVMLEVLLNNMQMIVSGSKQHRSTFLNGS